MYKASILNAKKSLFKKTQNMIDFSIKMEN